MHLVMQRVKITLNREKQSHHIFVKLRKAKCIICVRQEGLREALRSTRDNVRKVKVNVT